MTIREAAALFAKAKSEPNSLTGAEALQLQNALWVLILHALEGNDIRPILANAKEL